MSNNYETQLAQWRKDAEDRLRGPTGWLSVAGLEWLKPGANSVGSAEGQDIRLPKSMPARLGTIHLEGERATLTFTETANVTIEDQAAQTGRSYLLAFDHSGHPTEVKSGGALFFLIQRPNGIGVRMKDADSELRRNFKGRIWFEPDTNFIVEAEWHPLTEPKKLLVPDVLGNLKEEESPGWARFTLQGQEHSLYPIRDGEKLFFIFRDETSGKETYGSGRFLFTDPPPNGSHRLQLDFNKAVNPPCAFTPFATCPIPPPENRLRTAIRAGEKTPEDH